MNVLKIEKSPKAFKKYRATVVINGKLYKDIDFGDTRYEHFQDATPLKIYSNLDHNDPKRRRSYLARHQHNNGPAGQLARVFLW